MERLDRVIKDNEHEANRQKRIVRDAKEALELSEYGNYLAEERFRTVLVEERERTFEAQRQLDKATRKIRSLERKLNQVGSVDDKT